MSVSGLGQYTPYSNSYASNTSSTGSAGANDILKNLDSDAAADKDEVILSGSAASSTENSKSYTTTAEYMAYLKKNYSCLENGNVSVSPAFLKKCLTDSEAAADFETYLKKIPEAEKIVAENAESNNASLLKVSWAFDKKGRLSSVTVLQNHGSSFNADSQLLDSIGGTKNAAASMMSLLQSQLSLQSDITVKYSDAGTSAAAAAVADNSQSYAMLDLLA